MAKLVIKNKYWTIPNILLNNPNITFKAKWLFWYIQSKSDWRDFSADRIKFDTKESRDAILSWLKELEKYWFLKREKYQNDKWFWEIEYILDDNPTDDNPTEENPTEENPTEENPTTNKERNTNKEIIKKEIIIEEKWNFSLINKIEKVKLQDKIKNELNADLFINEFPAEILKTELDGFHEFWTESKTKKDWTIVYKWEKEEFFEINKRFRTRINNKKKWDKTWKYKNTDVKMAVFW